MLVPNWSLLDVSLAEPPAMAAADWRVLSGRSLVASGPNAPEQMLPVLAAYPAMRLATVRGQGRLLLALPLATTALPVMLYRTATSPVSFYGLPHLDPQMAVAALAALLRSLNAPLMLHSVPVGGQLWQALQQAAGSFEVITQWDRAVLRPAGSHAGWFDANFRRERRKEFRRLSARFAEQGKAEFASFGPGNDPGLWADRFIALEASGWKGRGNTAIGSDASAAATLRAIFPALAETGKLRAWDLSLDGRPIAMLYAIVEQGEAWLGKIAFDENYARFSPGVLLMLHATAQLFAEGLTQADSCAVPDHPMINNLWRDRLTVADIMVAAPETSGLQFSAALRAERLRRTLRARAKRLHNHFTGRTRP